MACEEAGGRRGRGREGVGGEIAERRVLLMTDCRDDRHRAVDDCPHEPFVTERKQVLEAATAASEHDDVHVGLSGNGAQCCGDLNGGMNALHTRLGHEQLRGRKPARD